MDRILHIPDGVRDIYNSECQIKNNLLHKITNQLHLFGFHDIQTPMFEFFEVFRKERGTAKEKDMYKFFDREGNILVLRPDMTPPIARCAAKYYQEEELPIRLCYCGSTFINTSGYQGKLKETTQLGAELINDSSVEADAEMIALTISCLKACGLEEFLIEIGEAEFFRALMEEAALTEDETEELRNLIETKNLFGAEELLTTHPVKTWLKDVIAMLPETFGTIDKIRELLKKVENKRAQEALKRLICLYEILSEYGYERYISFDLSMLSKYNYYTGIIFRGITYGSGEAVVTGGRYDSLVGQFGKNAPAIGMAVLADALMEALVRQNLIEQPCDDATLILYEKEYQKTAVALGMQFRAENLKISLLIKNPDTAVKDYISYAKRMNFGGILYLHENDSVEVIHVKEETHTKAKLSQLLNGEETKG